MLQHQIQMTCQPLPVYLIIDKHRAGEVRGTPAADGVSAGGNTTAFVLLKHPAEGHLYTNAVVLIAGNTEQDVWVAVLQQVKISAGGNAAAFLPYAVSM